MMPRKPTENGRSASSEDLGDWMQARDALVAQMGQDGTWQACFGPMLHEVAEALRMAAKLRAAAEEELFTKSERSGRSFVHPGISSANVEVRRAALLLARVAEMAKATPAKRVEPEPDVFAELDALERG